MKKIIMNTVFPYFNNSKVLLRADLNVSLVNNIILDDFRLQQLIPTIEAIFEKKGIIVLATHLGRPHGTIIPELSTVHLLPWFQKHGYNIHFEQDWNRIKHTSYPLNTIILLENLRFFQGEQKADQQFAQELASLAHYYVNDAFATLHRHDTSITLVPALFPPERRFLGPLIQKELAVLSKLKNNPAEPFVAIIGGGKVTTKIPLLEQLTKKASTIILMPAIVFSFYKAEGKKYGKSLIDEESIPFIQKLVAKYPNTFVYPQDYLTALNSWQGSLKIFSEQDFAHNAIGISIGPKSLANFKKIIAPAKTILINAASYFPSRPETMEPLKELLTFIAQTQAFSVVAGGESVAAARSAGLEKQMSYLSTGGGATLAYLSGEPLPGLQPFQKNV